MKEKRLNIGRDTNLISLRELFQVVVLPYGHVCSSLMMFVAGVAMNGSVAPLVYPVVEKIAIHLTKMSYFISLTQGGEIRPRQCSTPAWLYTY